MTATKQRQRQEILGIIENSTEKHHVTNVIDNIPFDDLISFLVDYVTNQSSPEILAKLYYAAASLPDIIGTDCTQHIVSFLEYKELRCLCGVSQTFHRLVSTQRDQYMNQELLAHPAFFLFFHGEWSDSIAYVMQTKYEFDDLNQSGFERMGEREILKGHEMMLWNICKHFGFDCKLSAYNRDDGDRPWIFDGEFCPLEDAEASGQEEMWSRRGGVEIFGRNSTEYDLNDDLCPVVTIQTPIKEWREKFILKNIKGNVYEQILMTHPAFLGYNQGRIRKNFMIGYHPQNGYERDDLCRYSVDELAERGILKGEDIIIWRLCKHFGFKMTKCMLLHLDAVHGHDEILIREFPFGYTYGAEMMTWKAEEWRNADWQVIYPALWYTNIVAELQREFEGEMYHLDALTVFQIECMV